MPNASQTKETNIPSKAKTKPRINKRQRNRRRNKQKLLNAIANQNKNQAQSRPLQPQPQMIAFSQSSHKRGTAVWNEAYTNAVRWHEEHQNNFWRHAAEQLQNENQMLRQQLEYISSTINTETEDRQLCYETSDEEEQNGDDDDDEETRNKEDEVDSKYLEFLQVTIEHRKELRLKREGADLLEEEQDECDKGKD